jgi:hypothetical protein
MNSALIIICVAVFSAIVRAQTSPTFPERSASFETLAKSTDARIIRSNEIARLEAGDSRAVFTGIAVAAPGRQDSVIRVFASIFPDAIPRLRSISTKPRCGI